MTFVDDHNEPEAAPIDIVDCRILRAVVGVYAEQWAIASDAGLPDAAVQALDDADIRYVLVFSHCLAGSISLTKAGEPLGMPALELRPRCLRLDVPIPMAPLDADSVVKDVVAVERWRDRLQAGPFIWLTGCR